MNNRNKPFGQDVQIIVLDCDGVMFDSAQANTEYYNSVLAQFGMPPMTPEQFAYAHMHTAMETLIHLFGRGERLKEALAAAKKMTYFPFVRLMRMEPFLMHLLTWLKPRFHTAIATNRTDTMGAVVAEHGLDGYFDMVVTSLDVEKPKPDPGQLLKIMEAYSIKGQHVLYVGDSVVDEHAAKAAGVNFIAYGNTGLNAGRHISSLVELEDILKDSPPSRG